MGTLASALRRAKEVTRPYAQEHIASGVRTAVNGRELFALWEDAEADRVQTFVKEDEWERGVYTVTLPRKALDDPWDLKMGSKVTRVETAETGTVRKLDKEPHKVTVLVVLNTKT